MAETMIENLEELIQAYTGPGFSVVDQKITNLTAPGENYCSTMLKVDLTVKNNDTAKTEKIRAVAKCAFGIDDPMMQQMLSGFFRNELNFYEKIVPFLQEFQKAQGVKDTLDIFPKMYAARWNLKGDNIVDHNAVLLLENLTMNGYSNVDRHVGFDLEGAKLILRDLAAFHAIPLAAKLKNPSLFQEKVKAFCKRHMGPPPKDEAETEPREKIWLDVLEECEHCTPYLPNLRKLLKKDFEKFINPPVREPFATLTHSDMWVNNTMQKETNGKLVDNKFVDFQMFYYGSPADDLMFFLFTSVRLQTLKNHFEDLLKFYHKHFRHVLESFGCNVVPFNYSNFIEEVKESLPQPLGHILFMNFVIFGNKGVVQSGMHAKREKEDIPPVARERFLFIVEELGRRGWI